MVSKYSDEEIAAAESQEQKDLLLEEIAMLRQRCVGLRIELNRAKARVAELSESEGS